MFPFTRLKWPEMRPVALELIARMHDGHARGRFEIPVEDFVQVFAPGARENELAKVRARGSLSFNADREHEGAFTLPEGERALFDLQREGLVLRIPVRLGGRYKLRDRAFQVEFNRGEELEGCKRVLLLICNSVVSVDVSQHSVDVRSPQRIFDLHVEF